MMKMNKKALGLTFLAALCASATCFADFGIYEIGHHNKQPEFGIETPGSPAKPTTTKANTTKIIKPDSMTKGFNYTKWSLTGKITQPNGRPIYKMGIYRVEYKDGAECAAYHLEDGVVVFDNITRGELLSFTRDTGEYVSLDFRAPDTINLLLFAPTVGMHCITLSKEEYNLWKRLDYQFTAADEISGATGFRGLIKQ